MIVGCPLPPPFPLFEPFAIFAFTPAHHRFCAHKTVAERAHSEISKDFFYPLRHNTLRQSKHTRTDRFCAHKPGAALCI